MKTTGEIHLTTKSIHMCTVSRSRVGGSRMDVKRRGRPRETAPAQEAGTARRSKPNQIDRSDNQSTEAAQ